MEDEKIEKLIPKEAYYTKGHKLQVINHIINSSASKLGLFKLNGLSYQAILTASSIKDVIEYYELFQEVISGENELVKVEERIKSQIIDFPKVAITYSIIENEEQIKKYASNNQKLASILAKVLNDLKDENVREQYKDINIASFLNEQCNKLEKIILKILLKNMVLEFQI